MSRKETATNAPNYKRNDLVTFNGENAIVRYVHTDGKVDVELTDRTDNGTPIWTPRVDVEKVTPRKAAEE